MSTPSGRLEKTRLEFMLAGGTEFPCYLIVDDSPLSLKWLAQILKSIGPCEVVEAVNGHDAIDKLASIGSRVDAIISDLRMPDMNGLELLKEVRMARTKGPQSVPFFIVTGFAERALAALALGLDVDAFLARPVKKQALKAHLIRTCAEIRAAKTPADARATYGEVDLTYATMPEAGFEAAPPQPAESPAPMWASHNTAAKGQPNGSVALAGERQLPLDKVEEGALLARDAVNSAGAVLLKAGEEITGGLKAVLMSYAEIDDSLATVWVTGRH